MANLYRDIHQVVKSFSIEHKLNLRLNNKIKLKCHFSSHNGFLKSVKLHGGGEPDHYIIIITARNRILSGRDFQYFKSLVEELQAKLKPYFPDVAMTKDFTTKPIQYGHAKLKLTNVKEETEDNA